MFRSCRCPAHIVRAQPRPRLRPHPTPLIMTVLGPMMLSFPLTQENSRRYRVNKPCEARASSITGSSWTCRSAPLDAAKTVHAAGASQRSTGRGNLGAIQAPRAIERHRAANRATARNAALRPRILTILANRRNNIARSGARSPRLMPRHVYSHCAAPRRGVSLERNWPSV